LRRLPDRRPQRHAEGFRVLRRGLVAPRAVSAGPLPAAGGRVSIRGSGPRSFPKTRGSLMRRLALLAILTAAGLACVFVPGLRADDAKVTGDLKKMQGTWVTTGGDPAAKWVIEGDVLK